MQLAGVLSLFLSVFAMLLFFLEQQTAVFIFWDEFIGIIDFGLSFWEISICKCLTFAFKRLDA
jgi:hypothetical protein